MLELFLIFVCFFGAGVLLLTTVDAVRTGGDDSIQRRLIQLRKENAPQSPEWVQKISEQEKSQRGDMKELITRITGISYMEQVEKQLAQADIAMKPSEFLMMRAVIVLLPPAIVYFLYSQAIVAGVLAIVGFIFPGFYLNMCAKGRVNKFNNQLAEFLILVTNGLRAGQTFLQGVDHAVKECPDPIAKEFRMLMQETNLGLPIETAFQNLVQRVPSVDLEIMATAFVIQKNVGGNLAEVMEKVAATIRERIKIQGQIKVLTAQGVMSGCLVGGLPFALGIAIYMLNPAYINLLFTNHTGNMILGGGLVLQFLGIITIKHIITIDV